MTAVLRRHFAETKEADQAVLQIESLSSTVIGRSRLGNEISRELGTDAVYLFTYLQFISTYNLRIYTVFF